MMAFWLLAIGIGLLVLWAKFGTTVKRQAADKRDMIEAAWRETQEPPLAKNVVQLRDRRRMEVTVETVHPGDGRAGAKKRGRSP